MSIFYRIVVILLIVAAGYSLYGIGHFKWIYYRIQHPKADFLIAGDPQSDSTVIEFINYNCGYCRELNPTIKELLAVRKDLRYIVRPVSFEMFEPQEEGDTTPPKKIEDTLTKIVFAAGLQDKFWEMHDAVLGYPEEQIPDDFIQETASLYNIDYDQLIKDANSKKVRKLMDDNMTAFNYVGLYSVPSFVMNGKIYTVHEDNLPDIKKILEFIASAEK